MSVSKGSQAAVEFVTTYSWAMIGVLLTLGALSYFDFLNTDRYLAVECNTGTNIECSEILIGNNRHSSIVLKNNYPVHVVVEGINLTIDGKVYEAAPQGILPRGMKIAMDGPVLSFDPYAGQKLRADLDISFRKYGSTIIYTTSGSAVVRVSSSKCGNSALDDGEQCDGSEMPSLHCYEIGLSGGDLVCTGSCVYDVSACGPPSIFSDCGNGIIESGEECDYPDLAGETCASLGYGSGALDCFRSGPAACTFNTIACIPVCGDGECQPGEDFISCPSDCSPPTNGGLQNPSFEDGKDPWVFVTDGAGTFDVVPGGQEGSSKAQIKISVEGGTDVEFYQHGLIFEPDADYKLTFWGTSNSEDMAVSMTRKDDPGSFIGLKNEFVDLGSDWREFTLSFHTPSEGAMIEGSLRLIFTDYDADGANYEFDHFQLTRV